MCVAIALGLGGCMRIYPDPELPDVEVEWFAEVSCDDDSERVVVSVAAFDTAEAQTVSAPCKDGRVRLEDVARVRYHVDVRLENAAGTVIVSFQTDVDLRDGFSKRVGTALNRPRGNVFRVAWDFDMGESCQSLSAGFLELRASGPDGETVSSWGMQCSNAVYFGSFPGPEPIALSARAISGRGVVATSPPSAPFAPVTGTVVDFGTLTLSPCDGLCPVTDAAADPRTEVAR